MRVNGDLRGFFLALRNL